MSGKYWRVQLVHGLTFPAGSAANPYDITVLTAADQWNPSAAGGKEWLISQRLAARPATAADAAAWRAAGAPANWHSGQPLSQKGGWLPGYPLEWTDTLTAATTPSPRTASWQVSDGTVGYVEGNLPGLNAAQFSRLPASQSAIARLLRGYYEQTYCAQHPDQGNPRLRCATQDQLTWDEAVRLLQDPVSPQVRSATFKVMAALPGVRVLGPVTDPLGRPGFALAPRDQAPNPAPEFYNPLKVIVVDPDTGELLATEELGPMPRTLHCLSVDARNRCSGAAYYGRSYPRQLDEFVALVSEAWTNAEPSPPPASRWTQALDVPGLPPF
jgi:hypothetical protein